MTQILTVSRRSVQVLRIMISGIFLMAGLNHLLQVQKTVTRIEMSQFKGFATFFGNLESW